jgi:hypothetical protein
LVYFFIWSVRQIVGRFDREDTPPPALYPLHESTPYPKMTPWK